MRLRPYGCGPVIITTFGDCAISHREAVWKGHYWSKWGKPALAYDELYGLRHRDGVTIIPIVQIIDSHK